MPTRQWFASIREVVQNLAGSRDVVGVRGERRERSPPVYVKRRAVFRVWWMNGADSVAHTHIIQRRISQVSAERFCLRRQRISLTRRLLKAASNSIHKTSAQTTWLTHQRQATCPIPTPLSPPAHLYNTHTCKLTKRWICIKALLCQVKLAANVPFSPGDGWRNVYYLAQIGLDSLVSVTYLALPSMNDCIRAKANLKKGFPRASIFEFYAQVVNTQELFINLDFKQVWKRTSLAARLVNLNSTWLSTCSASD